jgi:hypothetical protein
MKITNDKFYSLFLARYRLQEHIGIFKIQMLTHKKIKIWTIILHGLIIIAAGHGIAPLFMLEAFYIFNMKIADFHFSFSADHDHFGAAAFTALPGQVATILSLFIVKKNRKMAFHLSGLCMFWLSFAYLGYDAANNSRIQVAWFTAIPFFICTILTFTGKYLKRAYHWLGEHL